MASHNGTWITLPILDENSTSAAVLSQSQNGASSPGKTFHDRIHDQVRIPAALVAIIDTPQFQRLRDLKQLGFSHLVFPGGTHTRFEHSIGVAHLAMTMLRQVVANHAETGEPLDVTQQDVLCIGMAGLCHDLGHGPASHMFETFVNTARKKRGEDHKWHHEEASIMLFDHLVEVNNLKMEEDFGLDDADLRFVKALINGLKSNEPFPADIGRPARKRYLFDIVANKRNGIDVDKMDYFMRDSVACFGHMPDVQVPRLINCARVIEVDGQTQICYEEKVALTLAALFNLRAKLHKFVYQHRLTKLVEQMMLDALLLAEEGGFSIGVPGRGEHENETRTVPLSRVVEDMEAYSVTSDWIFAGLQASTGQSLAPARRLLTRIHRRQLYQLVGCCEVDVIPDVEDILQHLPPELRGTVPAEDVIPLAAVIKYGSSDFTGGDPMQHVRFFNPKRSLVRTTRVQQGQISKLFSPRELSETTLFVYTRNEQHETALTRAFLRWKESTRAADSYPFVNASPRPFRSPGGARRSVPMVPFEDPMREWDATPVRPSA
jgi:HD superfamily phosphohydrolase